MKILLYEAACAGELSTYYGSQHILCEGHAMARCLMADLEAAGHEVTLIVSDRSQLTILHDLAKANLFVVAGSPRDAFTRQLPEYDAAYAIAPESQGMLAGLVEMIEDECGMEKSLNSPSSAVRAASDKFHMYEMLSRVGIAVPRSLASNPADSAGFERVCKTLGFPLVLKPKRGAGCQGLTVAFTERELRASKDIQFDGEDSSTVIVQEYVRGVPASVSLICSEKGARPLSLNKQILLLDRRPGHSMYLGGVVPLDHGEMHQAFQAASRAAEVLGLKRGYVGVDFILAREGPVIVDINPRLTTSYVGLRQTASINVAEWMVNACLTGGLPASLVHSGYAIFLKTHVGCERGYVMVEGYGNTLAKAAGALRGALSALSLPGDRN